jgi:hypothetical protein
MMFFRPPVIAAALALVLALLAGAWRIHSHAYAKGYDSARAEQTAQALDASEKRRMDEKALSLVSEDVDRDLQRKKADLAVRNADLDERLREYKAALDRRAAEDSAPTGGIVDPRPTIASECPAALAAMDKHARSLGTLLAALQDHTQRVCVTRPD